MKNLKISYIPAQVIQAYAGNARSHSKAQIKQIVESIKNFGFLTPVLVDADNQLIAGHGRLEAAKQLGLTNIPALQVEHLTEIQRRAYSLADNKIAENAGWDEELLKVELDYLMSSEISFDVDLTGFSTPEIDLLMQPNNEPDQDDHLPDIAADDELITVPGDIWRLGKHRIACGDARDLQLIARLFEDEKARMVITDPPFNVKISGHVSGNGQHQHDEFAMASGEMSSDEFRTFLTDSISPAADICIDGALLYIFMDWRHLNELETACRGIGLNPINLCVWTKSSGGMGSLYRSQHELCLIVKKGNAPHINNVELGKHGRYRTNVWQYAGMNSFGADRDESLAMHPTVKPVAMIADAIKDVSRRNDIIFDPFLGSGTALIAAERCHRICYGVEFEPKYVDLALNRWIKRTGIEPIHSPTGAPFSEIREERVSVKAA